MEYIQAFLRAVGGKWLLLPGAVSGIIGIVAYVRDDLGLSWLPHFALSDLILLTALPILLWAFIGLLHRTVQLERRVLPRIKHLFDPNDPQFFHETWLNNDRHDQMVYVSVKVQSLSDAPVDDCAGFLLSVYRRQPGVEDWELSAFNQRQQLEWSLTGFERQRVTKDDTIALNIFRVGVTQHYILPCTQFLGNRQRAALVDRDCTYRFDLEIQGRDVAPHRFSLIVMYDGDDWRDIAVREA